MKKMVQTIFALLLVAVLAVGTTGCNLVTTEEVSSMSVINSEGSVGSQQSGESEQSTGTNQSGSSSTTGNGNSNGQGGSTSSSGSSNQTNQEPKLSGKMEIQLFTNDTQNAGTAWTDILDSFEEKTGVQVTAIIGSDANTKMTKRWMAGNPPDLALFAGAGIPDVALEKAGELYEVSDLLNNGYVWGTSDKIKDVVISDLHEISGNNKKYRPGFMASTNGILFDSEYLKTLGLSAPKNYKELTTFTAAVKAKNTFAYTTNGNGGHYSLWAMIMPAVGAYGQDFLDRVCKGTDIAAVQSAEFRSVLQRWRDFSTSSGAILTGTATFDHTTSQMKWLNHESVLIGNGIWLPDEMSNHTPAKFKMQYLTSPLVLDTQKPTVVLQPASFIIASKAKNIENAKAFIRFLYRKDTQTTLIAKFGYTGARKDMNYTTLPGLSSTMKEILTYIYSNNVDIRYKRYQWLSMNDYFNRITNELMIGAITVDEAVNKLVTEAQKLS